MTGQSQKFTKEFRREAVRLSRESGRTVREIAEDVADSLGISRNTLQRRLRDEGTTYQAELDAMRLEIGIRYLTKTNMNVDEIASVLAYRDANSFSRSFRRWTGTTPLGFPQEAANKAQACGANK